MPPYSYYTTTAGTSYTWTTANTTPYYYGHKMLIASKTVHCLREYRNLLKALHEDGYKWVDGESLLSDFVPEDRNFPFEIHVYDDKTIVYN